MAKAKKGKPDKRGSVPTKLSKDIKAGMVKILEKMEKKVEKRFSTLEKWLEKLKGGASQKSAQKAKPAKKGKKKRRGSKKEVAANPNPKTTE